MPKNLCDKCYNEKCPNKSTPWVVAWTADYQIEVTRCNYFENISVKEAREASKS